MNTALTTVAALVVASYGFRVGGVLGAMTGFVTAVGVALGLVVVFRKNDGSASPTRTTERIMGALAVLGCLAGSFYGGWRLGWLWGVGGYFFGLVSGLLVGARRETQGSSRDVLTSVENAARERIKKRHLHEGQLKQMPGRVVNYANSERAVR
jgi:hypothetical protein